MKRKKLYKEKLRSPRKLLIIQKKEREIKLVTLKILGLLVEVKSRPSLKCKSQTSISVVIAMNNKCANKVIGTGDTL